MKINTSIKSSLFSLFIALAASSIGSAQSAGNVTVSLPAIGPMYGPACTSSVSSISYGFSIPVNLQGLPGTGAGKASGSNITIVKANDTCSPNYILFLFKGVNLPTVTLTVSSAPTLSSPSGPLLTITLTNVFVSSVSDTDAAGQSLIGAEKVTLAYESIKIVDSTSNVQVNCSFATNTCNN